MLGEGIIAVAAQGFVLGAGLCCTLGPQSVYVLRQGMRRQDAVAVATVCAFIDIAMIGLGVVGFGAILITMPHLELFAAWGAAGLALAFGTRALQSALWPALQPLQRETGRRWGVIAMALALSLLNPQVYLEMMAFVGSVAVSYPVPARSALHGRRHGGVATLVLRPRLWRPPHSASRRLRLGDARLRCRDRRHHDRLSRLIDPEPVRQLMGSRPRIGLVRILTEPEYPA